MSDDNSTRPNDTEQWSAFAPSFARLLQGGPGIHAAEDMVRTVDAALPFAEATAILDVGCGPGQVIGVLIERFGAKLPRGARLLAADTSPGMLEQIRLRQQRETACGNAVWARVETVLYDALDLAAVADGSLSHVMAGLVYFMLHEPRRALREAFRVLTKGNRGGMLAVSSMPEAEWMELMSLFSVVRPDKRTPSQTGPWTTIEGVRNELEAVGFRDVEVHGTPTYMPFEDHAEIVEYLVSTFPFAKQITSDMTDDEVARAKALMVRHLQKQHPKAPAHMSGRAIIGVGRTRPVAGG